MPYYTEKFKQYPQENLNKQFYIKHKKLGPLNVQSGGGFSFSEGDGFVDFAVCKITFFSSREVADIWLDNICKHATKEFKKDFEIVEVSL